MNSDRSDMSKTDPKSRSSTSTDLKAGGTAQGAQGAAGAGAVPGIRPIALLGHRYECPVPGHEGSVIVTGSPTCEVHGRPIARIGDHTSCGAQIISGSKSAEIDDNRPIARLGDRGIHPELGVVGEIVEGLDDWTLE